MSEDFEATVTSTSRRVKGEIRPRLDHEICSFCGRTMLVGERPDHFEDPGNGNEYLVCTICRDDARNYGLREMSRVA